MPLLFRVQYRLVFAALTIVGGVVLTSCNSNLTAGGLETEPVATTVPAVATTAAPLDPASVTTTQTPTTVPPASSTTTIPTTTTTQPAAPEKGWLTLQGVGATSFDPSYIPNLTTEGYDFAFERHYGLFIADAAG